MKGGRVRKTLNPGITSIIDKQLDDLFLDILEINAGDNLEIDLLQRDYAVVLIWGQAECRLGNGTVYSLERRLNPFDFPPSVLMLSGAGSLSINANEQTLLALGSAPYLKPCPVQYIGPQNVRENSRGKDNWQRNVRLVCWSDNTDADQLMIGETITPSGNWSTIPPHRHAVFHEENGFIHEVPYREIYYYQFSRPTGFGLSRQFDGDGSDNTYSIISGDAVYIDGGYHPVVCAPGADMYQLTLMSGPYRQSTAEIHPDYRFLVDGDNPFQNQEKKS